jgi:hypothetical protein
MYLHSLDSLIVEHVAGNEHRTFKNQSCQSCQILNPVNTIGGTDAAAGLIVSVNVPPRSNVEGLIIDFQTPAMRKYQLVALPLLSSPTLST